MWRPRVAERLSIKNILYFAFFTQVRKDDDDEVAAAVSFTTMHIHLQFAEGKKNFFWFNLPMPRTTYQRFSFGSAESFLRGVAVTPFTCDVISIFFTNYTISESLLLFDNHTKKKCWKITHTATNYLLVVVQHSTRHSAMYFLHQRETEEASERILNYYVCCVMCERWGNINDVYSSTVFFALRASIMEVLEYACM